MLKQLSPLDASFVYMESPATPMHIGSLALYNGADSPFGELTEKKVLNFYAERLAHWPNARQRLVRVPLDADYPYWIEDRDFDLEYHIRRIGLPNPASIEELHKLTARIFSRPLDMTRPLWEIYIIDGLEKIKGMAEGSFAMLMKSHHAAVDGASGIHLMELLHDLHATAERRKPPTEPWSADPKPNDAELLLRASLNNLRQPFRFAKVMAQSAGLLPQALASARSTELPSLQRVPKTRFNGRVSAQRTMRWSSFSLAQISALRKAVPGASINDAILALCAGGLRSYLDAKNELNKRSLIAMAPINVRDKNATGALGNQVSAMFVPIGTDIADPIKRLAAVRKVTKQSKLIGSAVGARMLTDYGQFVPAFTAAMAARLMSSMAADGQPAFNLTITNVPGPQVPLYSMGARMQNSLGMGPISNGMGLIMPITSYCGEIAIGFTSCRDMIPDADFFRDCIDVSFVEFSAAAKAATSQLGDTAEQSTGSKQSTKPDNAAKTKTKPKRKRKSKAATKNSTLPAA
jgi:WS/DGAT/MGAT family acyltransferase